MEQPPGYIDPRFSDHVCKLQKDLYGFKQAPRAWFQRFSSFLTHLGFHCSRLFLDPTLYRSLVGALQYLTITRPDIAHIVNSVSQFLHSPIANHFLAVKCILRYVKGTLHYGLSFHPSASPGSLVAYSNADWAGCPDTRYSTSGYSIYLGDNVVSWSAKKQPTVSRSNCEFEYRALALTTAELLWCGDSLKPNSFLTLKQEATLDLSNKVQPGGDSLSADNCGCSWFSVVDHP
ncbi:secreted RxLR effector protein 161-like [Aristolochia californica]|uniref:secreted RxLR effector protein 161-like n=1 Tax=Aristolochia californica TaxID=171875 RepID=UPI0035DE0BFF